ncbi:hypothetical protein TTHERM_000695609 (macronuclear) [Tetrahymena thermophila SB210]|uniref:Uncharacterized protein n=1 Tax=Tetrahymena thermophila (strain SB210) TaxID=312017 RepID=W7WXK4_TETTS|nr:hypothetical protein TTHERM_000695609 [Tetrahymena thermophila SB210]EWS71545.1 hypothetical protein TTHERM_000695609 [Tetrahymena thermophila SB210]|eukprot:XP_012655928.1 hypothetical protein TTHERM_000695609 [Tetrahymena thermophila SB210]
MTYNIIYSESLIVYQNIKIYIKIRNQQKNKNVSQSQKKQNQKKQYDFIMKLVYQVQKEQQKININEDNKFIIQRKTNINYWKRFKIQIYQTRQQYYEILSMGYCQLFFISLKQCLIQRSYCYFNALTIYKTLRALRMDIKNNIRKQRQSNCKVYC